MDKTDNGKKKFIELPAKNKDKARCLEDACYGNSRIGNLLDYFIYGANLEFERHDLDESCNAVTITRKHKDILEKLNFNVSRKTLIRYLDLLSEWGYVISIAYSRDFAVDRDKIQEAIINPPQKLARAPRERKPAPIKGCNVVDDNLLKVVEDLQQKVVMLQLNVVELQQKVVTLQLKVDILSTLQPSLEPLAESAEGHNFDPYRNYCNNNNITVENIGEKTAEVEPSAPNVALSPVSQSSFSSFPQEETQEKQSPIAVVTTRNGQYKPSSKKKEEKAEPIMPLQDAPWPSRETAVQIVEAKKGRAYSVTTRKQELAEAGKVLEMTVDNAPITREQFESAWDDLASSSWWDEHGKPCMIKYLRRDDTIVGIVKKLKRKTRPSSPLQATIVDMEAERERVRIKNEQQLAKQREMQRKRAEAVKQGVNNG